MKRVELNRWQLRGYFNCDPLHSRSRETNAMTRGVTLDMDITTPHDLYADLQRYGYIDDPYYDRNSLKCEWVANRWWLYYTVVTLETLPEYAELVCEGIDGSAHVLVNETEIGFADNAFIGWTFDALPYLKTGKNEIKIIVENAPNEYGQIGDSTKLSTQKPKFNYKWDFCTRLISLGINKPVYLRLFDTARLENVYFDAHNETTGHADVTAEIFGHADGCTVAVDFDGKTYFAPAGEKITVYAQEVKLWNPNGYGAPNLYPLAVRLLRDGEEIDRHEMNVGFRRAEFLRNEGADASSYPYTYRINGRKVYIKGVNITPLMQTNFAPDSRYAQLVSMLRDAHVNFIRVWGGGVIESPKFFALCDAAGIMVMQDMPQSSCGLGLGTTKTPEFVANILKTADYASKLLRNHPSLVSWTGGNELMHPDHKPLDYDDPQIAALKHTVLANAPHTFFYPTTGSGPLSSLNPSKPGQNHDVHGPWNYSPDFYQKYNASDSYFHSEFGMDGMMCCENLKKFLPPEHLVCTNVVDDLTWRHHGEWWDHVWRDEEIFGGPSKDLQEMCERSQRTQAEFLRYAVEANRRRAFRNSGSVIWQANECYPNFAATTLIDFYMTPKPAYYAVAKACSPLNVSLQYEKYRWQRGETYRAEVFAIWDGARADTAVTVRAEANGRVLFETAFVCTPADGYAERLGEITLTIPETDELTVTLFAKNHEAQYENTIRYPVFEA